MVLGPVAMQLVRFAMAIDLVSLIKQFLTPDMVQKLAGMLGIDATQAQTAIGGAVPALLAGLTGTAAQPAGAQRLADAANQQASGLDNLAGMLGGSGPGSLVDEGGKLAGSLLGGNTQSSLASAISSFSGLGQGAVTALLGALTPMVLGVIGKQAGPQGFDAGSLGTLLNSQKDNIAKAMPARLGSLLDGTGVLDSLGSSAKAATGEVKQAAASAKQYADSTANSAAAATTTRSSRSWLTWLVPLVLVVGGLWYFLGRQAPPPAPVTNSSSSTVSSTASTATPSVVIGDVDVGKMLGDNLASLKTSLDSVTDVSSAQSALPRLTNIGTEIEKASSLIGTATAEQKAAIGSTIGPMIAGLTPVFNKVLAIPGVSEVLKPTIDGLKARLASIAS